MKKLLISILLVLALTLSAMLVACDGDGEYDDSESRQPVESHDGETEVGGESDNGNESNSGDESNSGNESDENSDSETEQESDSPLGVVEDTEEGWGEVHH